jgi:N-acetylneuraminic acid mutarotase
MRSSQLQPCSQRQAIETQRNHKGLFSLSGSIWIGFSLLLLACSSLMAQTGEWVWMDGSIPTYAEGWIGQPGEYGALGVPSTGNIPGSRMMSTSWTDKAGNVWIFGGDGSDLIGNGGYLNDLWEFNPASGQWTWVAGGDRVSAVGQYGTLGVEAPGNQPPRRGGAAGWVDVQGNLWLFGGLDYPAFYNDLWKFDITSGEWVWMGGSSTYPMDQYNNYEAPGVYGTLGTPSANNVPGSRWNAVAWIDPGGNFWLFGGSGYDSNLAYGSLNDAWKYQPSTGGWTWMGGSSTLIAMDQKGNFGQPGIAGTKGSPAAKNIPGGRYGAMGWTDTAGNLWLFGGYGYDSVGIAGELNDLWEFNSGTGLWAWMSGSSTVPQDCTLGIGHCGQSGSYGASGILNSTNMPGGRQSGATWTTPDGSLWLFGGGGFDSKGVLGNLNDLWMFDPLSLQWEWVDGSSVLVATNSSGATGVPGVYGTLGTPAATNTPGGRWESASAVDINGNLWLFGGADWDAIVGGDLNDLWEFTLPKSFGLSTAPADLTVSAGGQGTVTLTLTPQNGFNSAVSFACSGLPSGASCAFSPATVMPTSGAATTTLTISAAAQSSALRKRSQTFPPEFTVLLALGICGLRKRRNQQTMFLVVVVLSGLSCLSACGGGGGGGTNGTGGGGGGGSTPTVSTVTVTATSGSLQQSVKLTLTVN